MAILIFSPYCFPIFLSLSLSFFFSFSLPTLINGLHSFLGFSAGLGVLAAIRHIFLKKSAATPSDLALLRHDQVRRGAPPLLRSPTSCTESLGFESSDHTGRLGADDPIDSIRRDPWTMTTAQGRRNSWSRTPHHYKKDAKSFPPPLTSLNINGQPSFFLRPVRKDGRLELTEVRIHRPEILHVRRHDGRLTLHLIPDESMLDDSEDYREEEEEEEPEQEEEEFEGEIAESTREEEEDVGYGEWKYGMGGNEGLRCHEVVNRHRRHHRHLHHHHAHGSHNHPLHMYGVGVA